MSSQQLLTENRALPIVKLDGDILDLGEFDDETVKISYSDGKNDFEGYAKLSLQGHSSLEFDKKNYSIKLYKDSEKTEALKVKFSDWKKTSSYVLKANWIDFTNARNIVSDRLYKKMPGAMLPNGSYGVVDGFPAELYINGEYRGVYTLNQPKKKKTFGLKDSDTKALVYAAEIDNGSATFTNSSALDDTWQQKFPDERQPKTELNRLTEFISTCTYTEFREHIEEYMDLDSLLNYIVFSYISMNGDGLCKNYNIITFDGMKWYILPYDMDATFGLTFEGKTDPESVTDNLEYWMNYTRLWNKLKVEFSDKIYNRYVEVRNGALTEEKVIMEYARFMNDVGKNNYQREFMRWYDRPSKSADISQIRDYVYERYEFLDKYMYETYAVPGTYYTQRNDKTAE
jgi:spore coat protein CotH